MIYDLQKASLIKRFSAFLLDFILLAIVFTGAMMGVSSLTNYDSHFSSLESRLTEIQEKYNIPEIEKSYEVSFNEFQYMMDDEKALLDPVVLDAYTKCTEEMNSDSATIKFYETIMNLSMLIVSLSMLIAFLILEFFIPLLFKNGQTIGKKIFSIAVMRNDGVKISPMILFVRAILGKYTVGTMVPIMMILMLLFGSSPIVSIAVVLLIFLIQVILLLTSKKRSLIQDYLSSTVVVDFQSQMIFDSVEDKQEYQLRIHKEEADKAPY